MRKGKDGFYCKYIKRSLDFICALLFLIIFSWLYLILAILVRVNLGSPVIFHQKRPGKIERESGQEKVFELVKFRTMTNARDEEGRLLSDDKRLTGFGRFLRSTSLDELPEIWNVLIGEMSFIGPRPLVTEYLSYYKQEERRRHHVLPGLSGYAQVNGRNSLSWDKRFQLDVYYVDNVSFLLDVRVLLKTIAKVLKRSDIGQGEELPISFSQFRKKQNREREKNNEVDG